MYDNNIIIRLSFFLSIACPFEKGAWDMFGVVGPEDHDRHPDYRRVTHKGLEHFDPILKTRFQILEYSRKVCLTTTDSTKRY